jgi:hypothetical protein
VHRLATSCTTASAAQSSALCTCSQMQGCEGCFSRRTRRNEAGLQTPPPLLQPVHDAAAASAPAGALAHRNFNDTNGFTREPDRMHHVS